MDCIDPGSADIDTAVVKSAMEDVFKTYDLKATVVEINEITVDGNRATATAVIEYVNTGDTAYIDNRVTGTYTLVLKDGKWLITNSLINSVEYLDGVPADANITQADAYTTDSTDPAADNPLNIDPSKVQAEG